MATVAKKSVIELSARPTSMTAIAQTFGDVMSADELLRRLQAAVAVADSEHTALQ